MRVYLLESCMLHRTMRKKGRIVYSDMWIGFTEDKRNIAEAFEGICNGLSEADTLEYYRRELAEIAAKLGLLLEDGEKHE